MSLADRLNNRIDVYEKVPFENELGEKDYTYTKTKSVWAEITPGSGSVNNEQGNMISANVSHKIIIRSNSIPGLTNDMYFIFKGQRYDIKYFNPNFKYKDTIEIMCELVIE